MKVTTDACLFGGWVANEIKKSGEPKRILDIGTGTGLLSLMLAQVTKSCQIDAIEVNDLAFEQANANFNNSSWTSRLNIYHSKLQQFHSNHKYDLIICNPPFFNNSTKGKKAAKNLALHNESLPVHDLTAAVRNLLSVNGTCYVLYPEREMNVFTAEAEKSGLYPSHYAYVKNEKDQPIFRVMRCFTFQKTIVGASEIIIRKEELKYTNEFWELLKGYYQEYNNPNL